VRATAARGPGPRADRPASAAGGGNTSS